jgi:predicted anti-sigma-YlaC factor YlaD
MHWSCEQHREAVSARLDGETRPVPDHELDEHLGRCAECAAFAAQASALHRATRIRPAEDVPDLVPAVLAVAPRRPRPARAPVSVARWALGTVALTMAILALPGVLLGEATAVDTTHAARELGAFELALAAGLLVAALQPARAWGLLPLAGVLVAVLTGTAAIDALDGSTSLLAESPHLLELAGLVLLWRVGREDRGLLGWRPARHHLAVRPA